MQATRVCRICLVPENEMQLFSMFARRGLDAFNYQELTRTKLEKIQFVNQLRSKILVSPSARKLDQSRGRALICVDCSIDLSSAVKEQLKKKDPAPNRLAFRSIDQQADQVHKEIEKVAPDVAKIFAKLKESQKRPATEPPVNVPDPKVRKVAAEAESSVGFLKSRIREKYEAIKAYLSPASSTKSFRNYRI